MLYIYIYIEDRSHSRPQGNPHFIDTLWSSIYKLGVYKPPSSRGDTPTGGPCTLLGQRELALTPARTRRLAPEERPQGHSRIAPVTGGLHTDLPTH